MSSPHAPLPSLSPPQAAELLRAGAALFAEQLSSALPGMLAPALEHLASRSAKDAGGMGVRQLLSSGRDELRRKFSEKLKEEQKEALGRLLGRDKAAGRAPPTFTAESLSLVDDDADESANITAKVARRMRGALEAASSDIQTITGYLTGKENVRNDDDPFAPDACVKALLDAARDQGLEPAGWDALVGAFDAPMTEALRQTYEALREHFRRHHVGAGEIRKAKAARQALGRSGLGPPTLGPTTRGSVTERSGEQRPGWLDTFSRVQAVQPPGAGAGGEAGLAGGGSGAMEGGPGAAGGGPGFAGGPAWPSAVDARASLENIIGRMSAAAHGAPIPIALPAAGRPPPDLMAAISEMQRRGAQEVAAAQAAVAFAGPTTLSGATTISGPVSIGGAQAAVGLDQGLWREGLLAKSTRTVDKLTIEIVGMLFEHVLQDNQVPAEIKAVLSRLQFPVLKVALTDADFFASGAHPARRLIDRLASTAVGWEPYGDENQRYKAELERVVQQVLERFDKDVGVFEQLLTEFEAFLGEIPARETDPIARAKRALEEAEKREVLVINTTIQVRRAFENVELEPYLREFLVGPWVQALVSASLRDEQTPGFSNAFRQVIHDVVWSVQPKVSADERKRLVGIIPGMTRVLRDGLALIQMSENDQQAFLKQLMASHAVAVRPVDQATYIKSRVATGDMRQKLEQMQLTGSFPLSAPSGGVRVSANAVKRAAAAHAAALEIAEPIANATPLSFDQDADYDAEIAGWQRGSWFNLHDGKQTVKVKLRWISPLRTLFMFSGGEEKNARVLSQETIKSYLRQGWLKPLESEPLMKRVVERVVGEFERSPKRREQLVEKIGATEVPSRAGKADAPEVPKLPDV
jgi:hypothetical protein